MVTEIIDLEVLIGVRIRPVPIGPSRRLTQYSRNIQGKESNLLMSSFDQIRVSIVSVILFFNKQRNLRPDSVNSGFLELIELLVAQFFFGQNNEGQLRIQAVNFSERLGVE